MAHLQFPSLVIQRGDLLGRILRGLQQRRQQRLGPEARALIHDPPKDHRVGQLGMLPFGFARDHKLAQLVAGSQLAHGARLEILAHANQKVPLFAARTQRKEDRGREEAAIQNDQRLVGNLGKERLGIAKLVRVVRPKFCRQQQV